MKYTSTVIAIVALLLRFTLIMAQTSDCQKKCDEAFIKCSGTCASSADTTCGARCIKDRDACAKNCSTPVKPKPETDKPKPAPDINEDSDENGDDDDDDDDVDDDTDIDADTDDTQDDHDSPDLDEDDL